MKKQLSIQLKAAFLMLVFSLNTVIGFACAIGIDMGFNSKDHHGKEAVQTSVHVHGDGKKHIHHEKTSKQKHDETPRQNEEATETSEHEHADGKKHVHHNEAGKHHDEANNHKEKKGKDDCCNDKVIKITQVDKSIPQSLSTINPVFFTTFNSSFYNISPLFTSRTTSIKYFVRGHHPPIPDIRIAIQSFQI